MRWPYWRLRASRRDSLVQSSSPSDLRCQDEFTTFRGSGCQYFAAGFWDQGRRLASVAWTRAQRDLEGNGSAQGVAQGRTQAVLEGDRPGGRLFHAVGGRWASLSAQ